MYLAKLAFWFRVCKVEADSHLAVMLIKEETFWAFIKSKKLRKVIK
jgi:hypothetical protein